MPATIGLARAARILEDAGYDSLWASDHIAMPDPVRSPYPFSADASVPWDLELPWSDPMVALGIAAAVTDRIELGTAILVATLRHPLVLAKQVATVAVEARGRVVLGVGAGWLAEEFEAVGVPFERRGALLNEWIDVARQVWGGRLPRAAGGAYPNPHDMICRPLPPQPVPVLVGGMGRRALERAGAIGDGWLGLRHAKNLRLDELAADVAQVHRHAEMAGRRPGSLRIVLQLVDSTRHTEAIADGVSEMAAAGVDEIIVDPDWDDEEGPARTLRVIRSALVLED